jgi:hypothetical protein
MVPAQDDIPLAEIPKELLDVLREKVWTYTASIFAVEHSRPTYRGTVTCVTIAGRGYLLTAAHVWRELRGDCFALSLEADRLLVPVRKDVVEAIILEASASSEWGPDLVLIGLPDLVVRDISQVKAFYNVDKRRPQSGERPEYDVGVWAVVGAPAEQSVFREKEAILKISLFASVVASAQEREGFDYVDLSYYHEDRPDLPRSYGGISGSGLWHLPISTSPSGTVRWSGDARLEGVAFYQKPSGPLEGTIRCHGRKSLYEHAFARCRSATPMNP